MGVDALITYDDDFADLLFGDECEKVERIVRCKDCKHCKPLSNFHRLLGCYNDFLNKHEAIPVCEYGFCAWGEWREDD